LEPFILGRLAGIAIIPILRLPVGVGEEGPQKSLNNGFGSDRTLWIFLAKKE
jgi:hypothetical protein